MVIKPNGYAVWEVLQREPDQRFKASNHQNVYFPLLIPRLGVANGNGMGVRAAAYVIAGHELHHMRVLREKYWV